MSKIDDVDEEEHAKKINPAIMESTLAWSKESKSVDVQKLCPTLE